ncbi:MAG: hypothetical protein ACLRIP_07720 [Blautia massiliensis (ex Durand et al. 2017)]
MQNFGIFGRGDGWVIFLATPVILHFTNLTDIATGYLKNMLFISSYYVIGKSINSMTIGGIFPAGEIQNLD